MKKLIFIFSLFATIALSSCQPNGTYGGGTYVNSTPNTNAVVTPQATNLGDNLNLQALGELVRTSQNAQDIEQKLNQPNSINNLDLDNDGKVDYINVTEYNTNGVRGFSFTVNLAGGQTQEVATVELQTSSSNQATMNIVGNQSLYGPSAYYSSNYLFTNLLIYHYLFYPHSFYVSPWGYGRYPSYYHTYGYVGRSAYSNRIGGYTKTTTITKSTKSYTSSSPNRTSNAPVVSQRVKQMSAPQASQKSFRTTSPSNSKPSTSGFTRPSSTSTNRSSSFGSSRSSSSGGSHSFGGSSGRRSDARFKTNIKPLSGSLNKICSLKGVTYDWRVNQFPAEKFDYSQQIGFLAQDLEKVYPQVVNTRPDGYKTVNYDLLVPVLVEAIKELKTKTEAQDSVIKLLTTPKTSTTSKSLSTYRPRYL